MAQGLVINNADGSVKLDTNSNITRTIGKQLCKAAEKSQALA